MTVLEDQRHSLLCQSMKARQTLSHLLVLSTPAWPSEQRSLWSAWRGGVCFETLHLFPLAFALNSGNLLSVVICTSKQHVEAGPISWSVTMKIWLSPATSHGYITVNQKTRDKAGIGNTGLLLYRRNSRPPRKSRWPFFGDIRILFWSIFGNTDKQ